MNHPATFFKKVFRRVAGGNAMQEQEHSLLEMRHINKLFPGVKALSDVDLDIINKMENQLNKVNKSISKIREMVVTIDLKK